MWKTKKTSYLGVDIGSAGIKIVELKNQDGRPRLLTYGFAEEKIDVINNDSVQMKNKVAGLIIKICEQARTSSDKIVAALPSFSVFSSIISLPYVTKKELGKVIYWQAKKFVPMDLNEMTLDWKLLNEDVWTNNEKSSSGEKISEGKKNIKVLIAASPKKLVLRYIDIFKMANLDLISLETENFALERSLVGNDKSPIMIVDIGCITSDISVVENGIPVLSRSVDTGGDSITQSIMNSMHVDFKRAEQFKRDIGFSEQTNSLPKVIESVVAPIINEIKYCFDLYASQESNKRIEKIILTGGSAFLPKIDEYLAGLLNIKVFVGDPWARVIYPLELKSVLNDLAPRFSIAVGLAMREIV
ncbi:type IV pilus assembly protein PilM [Candidatus Parcubacteria bacterium]|nr:type IV pilus assembly protein PilM [Patescibacteria group bacterium]MBU4482282.1 type IV pilus assembly protein PilM [Patescibacteria group bacterium]MCG2686856.1 type IV pilus assembly protein PilM [Candidatus Parcubacteria bacterium]